MFEPYRILSVFVLFGGSWFQYREYSSDSILDLSDHYLLFCNHILMASVMIGGWIMQVVYYSVLGTHCYIGLIVCSFSRYNPSSDSLFNIVLTNGCLLSYLLLKVFTQKSNDYGVGQIISGEQYLGVSESLNGWNCTFGQFWVFSLFWLIQEIYSIYVGYTIIKREAEVDHLWKKYFIKRKVIPTILFIGATFAFNLYSYLECDSPTQCMDFWVGDNILSKIFIQIIKIMIYIGPSVSVLFFYYFTMPLFRRSNPDIIQQLMMI